MCGVSVYEERPHAEATSELDVGEGVADHEACGGVNFGEVGAGLTEEAGERLAAVALELVVGAEVEGINVRIVRSERTLEFGVDLADIVLGVEAESNAALVRDHNDTQPRAVEAMNGFDDSRQWIELAPTRDEATLRQLAVEDAVAIQKDGAQWAGRKAVCLVGHNDMITTVAFH